VSDRTAPPNAVDQFVAACGFGICLEVLTEFLNKILGILPEPFSHLWFGSDTAWNIHYNRYVLEDCALYSLIVIASLAGIWFCAGKANGLYNSKAQKSAVLIAILVTAALFRIHEGRPREPERAPPIVESSVKVGTSPESCWVSHSV